MRDLYWVDAFAFCFLLLLAVFSVEKILGKTLGIGFIGGIVSSIYVVLLSCVAFFLWGAVTSIDFIACKIGAPGIVYEEQVQIKDNVAKCAEGFEMVSGSKSIYCKKVEGRVCQ